MPAFASTFCVWRWILDVQRDVWAFDGSSKINGQQIHVLLWLYESSYTAVVLCYTRAFISPALLATLSLLVDGIDCL